MRVAVIGAGAAGLLLSLLLKRRFPAWGVETFEQNPEGATYGFGVVFSDGALAFLERDEPELSGVLEAAMERWPMQRIVHRGKRVDVDGNGFSAIGRLALQQMLQNLCRRSGVAIRYGRGVSSLDELANADLVVGADGSNSLVRNALAAQFEPRIELLSNRFAWYGTAQPFDCLTLTFRENEHGAFVAHHYRHSPSMSTFVVECGEKTWRAAGLDRMGDAESRVYCERVFAGDLGGHGLESNKSLWRQFPLVRNRRWVARLPSAGHAVLLGDALRTVHFSIGSGTRLAIEDAIALTRALEADADVSAALARYEAERKPIVKKLVTAARTSADWYEHFPVHMKVDLMDFAYSYITRSGRIDDARLRAMSPMFMARYEASRRKS
jgi:2-polyprenyl-6-methoxyphenol hydroxylase-like FAD-dependent oxidoreductase